MGGDAGRDRVRDGPRTTGILRPPSKPLGISLIGGPDAQLQQGHALIQIDGGEPVGPYRACPAATRETSGSSKRFFVMSVTCVAQHIPQVVDQQQLDTHA